MGANVSDEVTATNEGVTFTELTVSVSGLENDEEAADVTVDGTDVVSGIDVVASSETDMRSYA